MSSADRSPSPRSWELYGVLLTLTGFAISANAIPPLATTIGRDLGVRFESFGYLFLLQYCCFSFASLSGGWMTQRFGVAPRLLVTIGVFGAAGAFLVGALLSGFGWFIGWIMFLGYFGGLIETFSSVVVSSRDRHGSSKLLNLSQVFHCLGAIGTPYAIAVLLHREVSWRLIFTILGLATLTIGLTFTLVSRHRVPGPRPAGAATEGAGRVERVNTIETPRWIPWLILAAMFVYVINEISLASWVSPYFEEFFHISADSAAWRLGTFWTGLVLGRLLMLVLPDRLTVLPALVIGSTGMVGGCILLSVIRGPDSATAVVVLVGLAAGPVWPAIVSLSKHAGRSTRFTAAVIAAGALGAALGPLCSAIVIRYLGLRHFFPALSCGCLALVILAVGLRGGLRHRISVSQGGRQ